MTNVIIDLGNYDIKYLSNGVKFLLNLILILKYLKE